MMLGFLLARAGISVVVLEKHADFLRDFRGDTIHPSTLQVMHELGLLEELLRLPHEKAPVLRAQVGDTAIAVADFTHLPARCGFIAIMPQWDFLDFLARHASRYPNFELRKRTEAVGLIEDGEVIKGVHAATPDGPVEIRADLVIAADGRHSAIRDRAGLAVETLGAPMDVLWFRLSRRPDDPGETMGRFDVGRIFVLINRGAHWQCGFVIPKGSADDLRARGLPAFRDAVARLVPFERGRLAVIASGDDVKLLTVGVDRVLRWSREGLLCIGDAAHTMSPVGGVGINLAIQDAVAAANILVPKLRNGGATTQDLARVQQRRELPTRITQRLQVQVQNRIVHNVLNGDGGTSLQVPWALRLLQYVPALRRLPARLIGIGIRPEHVAPALRN